MQIDQQNNNSPEPLFTDENLFYVQVEEIIINLEKIEIQWLVQFMYGLRIYYKDALDGKNDQEYIDIINKYIKHNTDICAKNINYDSAVKSIREIIENQNKSMISINQNEDLNLLSRFFCAIYKKYIQTYKELPISQDAHDDYKKIRNEVFEPPYEPDSTNL